MKKVIFFAGCLVMWANILFAYTSTIVVTNGFATFNDGENHGTADIEFVAFDVSGTWTADWTGGSGWYSGNPTGGVSAWTITLDDGHYWEGSINGPQPDIGGFTGEPYGWRYRTGEPLGLEWELSGNYSIGNPTNSGTFMTTTFSGDGTFYLPEISPMMSALRSVPIPSAIWMLGAGLVGIVGFRRKFRKV